MNNHIKNNTLPMELLESESKKNNLDSEKTKEKKINNFLCLKLAKKINERVNIKEEYPIHNLDVKSFNDKIIVSNIRNAISKRQLNSVISTIGFDDFIIKPIFRTNTYSIEFFNRKKESFEKVD